MKLTHYSEAEARFIDNDVAKGVTGRVVIGKKDGAASFCMRVFELAPGGYTPLHKHAWEHEIFVHSGEGAAFQNGAWSDIKTGSVLFIPGDEVHQMKNTGKDPIVFVCLIPSGPPEL